MMMYLTLHSSRLRVFVICLVAMSVSLPVAWVSLGRLLLMVGSLLYLITRLVRRESDPELRQLWSVPVSLLALAVFALGVAGTVASDAVAWVAFCKHSKIIGVALLVCLIRQRQEALLALAVFLVGQAIFIVSSWVMVAGFRVLWATSDALQPGNNSVVYSSYLDQTLIFTASAAVFWHLRGYWPRDWSKTWSFVHWLPAASVVLALAAVVNVLFFQDGKSAYVAVLAVCTLALVWQLPSRWRVSAVLLAPLVLGLLVYASSARVQLRVAQIIHHSQSYIASGNSDSSSGFRLHAWRLSLQAMAQRPLTGHGTGSWTVSIKRMEGEHADQIFGDGLMGNPHQEFLLWGVELGWGGTALLLAWLFCLVRDALHFDTPVRYATWSVVAVMGVACLFNCALYDALIGDFFCVTLGLLMALGVRRSTRHVETVSGACALTQGKCPS